jgi:hypothetical protein
MRILVILSFLSFSFSVLAFNQQLYGSDESAPERRKKERENFEFQAATPISTILEQTDSLR